MGDVDDDLEDVQDEGVSVTENDGDELEIS